jgi:outer membrane protein assembly factor BamB
LFICNAFFTKKAYKKIPVIGETEIYLNNSEEMLVFDAISGTILNRYPLKSIDYKIDNEYIFSYNSSKVEKRLKDSGKLIWDICVNPKKIIVLQDSILHIDRSSKLCSIDKKNGKMEWQSDWKGYTIKEVEEEGQNYIIKRNDNSIFVVDKNTGEKLWYKPSERTILGPKRQSFKIYNDVLILCSDQKTFNAYKLPD